MQESNGYRIHVDYLPSNSTQRKTLFSTQYRFQEVGSLLPVEMGEGRIRFEQHDDGLGFGELYSEGAVDRFEFRVAVERECFKIPFLLSTEMTEVGIEGTKNPVVLAPTASYLLSPTAVGTAAIPAQSRLHLISFFLPPERLEVVLDDMEALPGRSLRRKLLGRSGDPYLHSGIVTPALRTVVDQIRHCQMQGSLRHLYLEGKLLELAALRLQELGNDSGHPPSALDEHLTNRDRNRIREATEIIAASMYDPPTIHQLARLVGLNATKLKRGFRSELGITVFGFVHRLRMEQALALLRDSDLNVTEIALEVGYGTPSAFSAAFKRDFGVSPSSVMKRRRGQTP